MLLRYIFTPPLEDYLFNKKFVFHHIQKCAGTSLNELLSKCYILKKDYSYINEKRININRLLPFHLLVGHFETHKTQLFLRYPEVKNKNIFLFTMIRDPLQFKVSLYYYWKKEGIGWFRADNLRRFLDIENNYLSKNLGCDSDNYLEILSQYSFIGIVEEYEASINLLSELLKRKLNVSNVSFRLNSSHRNSEYMELIHDSDYIKQFHSNNELDYKIYEYAKSRLSIIGK